MKKIFIVELLFILIMLLGCSSQIEVDNRLIKSNPLVGEISKIEIENDIYKKTITDQSDLDLIISYIEDIQVSNNKEGIENIEEDSIFRIKIYNKEGNIYTSISIAKNMAFYDKKWYSIEAKSYDKIRSFYRDNLEYIEEEDDHLLYTKQGRLRRKAMSESEALQGIWISENDSKIKFINNYFYQGNQYDYVFEYKIIKEANYDLDISIYGIKGVFVKGKELSNIHIKMDTTKSHMIMKTTMAGGMTDYDKLIYVDEEDNRLGTFDSYFFYENSGL